MKTIQKDFKITILIKIEYRVRYDVELVSILKCVMLEYIDNNEEFSNEISISRPTFITI